MSIMGPHLGYGVKSGTGILFEIPSSVSTANCRPEVQNRIESIVGFSISFFLTGHFSLKGRDSYTASYHTFTHSIIDLHTVLVSNTAWERGREYSSTQVKRFGGFSEQKRFSPAKMESCAARSEGKCILVTGGAGFIGTHTALQLLGNGFTVYIIDNLDNSVEEAVIRVKDLAGPQLRQNLHFYLGDLCKREDVEKVFTLAKFDAVIHFAGLKAVGESVAKPLRYYNNNLVGTLNLIEIMANHGCKKLVFSSSATVYGQPKVIPCVEDFQLAAMNPYGHTKLFIEEITRDVQKADPEWRIILLRYFNPVGAHPSGEIGEDPKGIPNNLMPFIQQVAVGRQPELRVFGTDYPTKDGTAVRDYIHVMDLADGHIAALQKVFNTKDIGCTAYNLGTGCGTSVLEMVAAFEKASGKKIPIKFCARRPGDATAVYASTEKAARELGWKAKYGIEEMCRDQWNWASKNPWGYISPETTDLKTHTS